VTDNAGFPPSQVNLLVSSLKEPLKYQPFEITQAEKKVTGEQLATKVKAERERERGGRWKRKERERREMEEKREREWERKLKLKERGKEERENERGRRERERERERKRDPDKMAKVVAAAFSVVVFHENFSVFFESRAKL